MLAISKLNIINNNPKHLAFCHVHKCLRPTMQILRCIASSLRYVYSNLKHGMKTTKSDPGCFASCIVSKSSSSHGKTKSFRL